VLTVLYSPGHFVRPVLNALLIENRLAAQDVPLFKLEVALGNDLYVWPADERTFHLRSTSCMFQKERLLNVLASRVPPSFTKLLFLDGDVLLANAVPGGPHWYDALSALLDGYDVVQPFDVSGHLDLSFTHISNVKCSVLYAHRNASLDSQIPAQQLHTGLAWAFSRAWLHRQGGMFDVAIHGGGDSINAAAFGRYELCMPNAEGQAEEGCLGGGGRIMVPAYANAFRAYVAKIAEHPPRVTPAHGLVALDLFHGSKKKRQYTSRLAHFEGVQDVFSLVQDDKQGIYEFVEAEPRAVAMNATICEYFTLRAWAGGRCTDAHSRFPDAVAGRDDDVGGP